jgi:hypothetical protein
LAKSAVDRKPEQRDFFERSTTLFRLQSVPTAFACSPQVQRATAGNSRQTAARPAAGPEKSLRQRPATAGNPARPFWQAVREKPGNERPQQEKPAAP